MKMKLISLICLAALCSCTVVQPAWEGTKQGASTVVETGENVVTWVWQEGVHGLLDGTEGVTTSVWGGSKSLFNTGIVAAEDTVYAAYDFVTDPFTGEDVEE